MQKYQFQLQKAQMLQQAKMTAYQSGREEHQRVYEAQYRATKDTYLAEQAAREAAEKKARDEWERKQHEIEWQLENWYKEESKREYYRDLSRVKW